MIDAGMIHDFIQYLLIGLAFYLIHKREAHILLITQQLLNQHEKINEIVEFLQNSAVVEVDVEPK